MKIIKTLADLEKYKKPVMGTLAFVPTMGALHDGHLALVKAAQEKTQNVIVSIYVNPTQFAPHEDFSSYPRTVDQDIEKLEMVATTALWLPSEADIYPTGKEITVKADAIAQLLEGEFRPHFFDGVATVVARLFRLVKPDSAFFGEKDFQQLQVIKKMVKTENIPIQIYGVPTMRDQNGLALSSRNVYLNANEYKIAIQLNVILQDMANGKIDENKAHEKLLAAGFDKVDYCTARNSFDFSHNNPDRVLAAAWLGKTRLIDNMAMA